MKKRLLVSWLVIVTSGVLLIGDIRVALLVSPIIATFFVYVFRSYIMRFHINMNWRG